MRKKKCLLLVHDKTESFFSDSLKKLSRKKKFILEISDDFHVIDQAIDFVFCINYQHIIPKQYIGVVKNGIYVFHSSDLPKGRGWAPLYYSIMSRETEHVLTMLKIDEKVDTGEIIAKAYFKKRNGEYAESLREVDTIMTMKVIHTIIDDLLFFTLQGKKQKGKGTYYPKRSPQDSDVQTTDTLQEIYRHCLAVTREFPAFFYEQGQKYIIHIRPESLEKFHEKNIKIVPFYEKSHLA